MHLLVMRVLTTLLACLLPAALLLGFGFQGVRTQTHLLQHAEPVDARVDASTLLRSRLLGVKPAVRYTYSYRGQAYTAERVTPLNHAGGLDWARVIVRDHRPGRGTTAYVNPQKPGRAYLVPTARFTPYVLLMVGIALATLPPAILFRMGRFDRAPQTYQPKPTASHRVQSASQPLTRLTLGLMLCVLLALLASACCVHYLWVAEPLPLDPRALLGPAAVLAAAVYAFGLGHKLRLALRIADTAVGLSRPEVQLHKRILIRIEQAYRHDLPAPHAQATLVCERQTAGLTERLWSQSCPLEQVRQTRPPRNSPAKPKPMRTGEAAFEIPRKKQRAALGDIRWAVLVTTTWPEGQITTRFPLPVQNHAPHYRQEKLTGKPRSTPVAA